ncbi:PGF-pre-PGF domain-containing protein [uncultured Methanoregula sp.]|uniref:PGF-pre-PGF domain-containing protein n=1 Tax=uncultured Methanoregula sp. TaxID=1005933 RepID=UPI002AAAF46C|nr:PGF-pre-PGF domain-containing protein [uncultured Methanoregula sp.]
MRGIFTVLVLAAFLLSVPATGAAASLVITQPSANETKFAEMRDFYVYGIFSTATGNPGDIRIELYPESACTGDICTGLPMRSIQSHVDPFTGVTNSSQIDWSFVDGITVKGGYVPDIIKEPGGYTDPNNKVVVTNTYYGGLVPGGVTKTYNTTYKNSSGYALQDITAGSYKINVTGLSGSFAGKSVTKTITFGITDTALGTNRPADSKNVRISYAIDHGLRTYFDNFPGYFSDGGSNWTSLKTLAASNNGIEVVNDLSGTTTDVVAVSNNTMFMYNINSESTTYAVEIAPMLKYNLQDGVNTTFLYYGNGEPTLTFNDSQGVPRALTSTLKQFSGNNRIALTHLDVRDPTSTSYENLYDPNDTTWKSVYTDLSGTIGINPGQTFIIYGVAKPIPSTVSSTSIPYWYGIDKRTSQLACTITDAQGNVVSSSTHDVNLNRYYFNYPGSSDPHRKLNSLFEFGAEFTGLNTPGTYTVTLAGRDTTGATVSGATTLFNITVTATPTPPPYGGDNQNNPSSTSRVAVSPGAPAGQPVTFAFTPGQSSGTTAVESVTLTPSRAIGQAECIVQAFTPGASIQLTDRDVAGYQSITVNWISPDAIDHADIAFSLDKAWLTAHHVAPEQVVMLRYTGNQWVELPTTLVNTLDNVFEYRATTKGFSYFAIAGKAGSTVAAGVNGTVSLLPPATDIRADNATLDMGKASPAADATGSPVTTTVSPAVTKAAPPAQPTLVQVFFPQGGIQPVTIIAWAIVIAIIIIAAWLIRRWYIQRQNPALFRKY